MRRTALVQEFQLPIEIKKDGEFFLAQCPIWHDCYAQGKTIDEVTAEILAVASSLIELYQEEGLKIPLKHLGEEKLPDKISFSIPVFSCT